MLVNKMKIQPYLDKLNASQQYKDFTKKFPDAFMAAGFFVIDFEGGNNVHQLDFYVPSQKKIAAFTLDSNVGMQMLDGINEQVPKKLEPNARIDLDALQGIIEDEMKNRGMTEELKKMIAVLQNIDGKKVWNVNCVLSGLHILKANVEDDSKSILEMEKRSILEFVKPVAMENLGNVIPKQDVSKKDISGEIEKLDKLEKIIEKKKKELKKVGKKLPKS